MNKINLMALFALVALLQLTHGAAAATPKREDDFDTAYDGMKMATALERQQLQAFALKNGLDYDGFLSHLPDYDDVRGWTKFFTLAPRFDHFDRLAQLYGYNLSALFFYYNEEVGSNRFMKLLNAQSPKVRQLIRDFIFYGAVMAGPDIHARAEAVFRKAFPALFPSSYTFGQGDKIFTEIPQPVMFR